MADVSGEKERERIGGRGVKDEWLTVHKRQGIFTAVDVIGVCL